MTVVPIKKPEVNAAPKFSEEALALRFTEKTDGNLKFTAERGKWSEFTGERWADDKTLSVFERVRKECKAAASECASKALSRRIASAATVAAVERLARCDRRHAMELNAWDADPWLLNHPSGTVDLRTGESRPHRVEDYCTKTTGITPIGMRLRIWTEFLDRVTNGDKELQKFLQRVFGYCLTGGTWEHVLFFVYGTGANGKSVFTRTLSGVLGDYATTGAMDSFVACHGDRHPTDLAKLHGARLVTASETEDGRRWDENRIKSLTGGDQISARFMRQDFFDFTPQFKLVIAGNHKPALRSVDEAFRRRLHLIPFAVTIPEKERDRELPDKLKEEYSGILDWAIRGCLLWQTEGLNAPAAVVSATEQYLSTEDVFTRWLSECCMRRDHTETRVADLYASWKYWAEAAGEFVGSERRFSQNMESHGFAKSRIAGSGRMSFRDIGLLHV